MPDHCALSVVEDPVVHICLTKRQLRILYRYISEEIKAVEELQQEAQRAGDTVTAISCETRLTDLDGIAETCFFDTFLAEEDSEV